MTDYIIENPDGTETSASVTDLIDLVDKHEIVACILAGCSDAEGYRLHNLTTGSVTITEDVRAKIETIVGEVLQKEIDE